MPPLIIVVDDHLDTCALIARVLQSHGYGVTSATESTAALAAAAIQTPDLVIADVLLPDLSGLHVIATLRQQHPGLPAIALSAYPNALTEPELVPADFDPNSVAFLAKPFGLATLVDLVQQQMRQPLAA